MTDERLTPLQYRENAQRGARMATVHLAQAVSEVVEVQTKIAHGHDVTGTINLALDRASKAIEDLHAVKRMALHGGLLEEAPADGT